MNIPIYQVDAFTLGPFSGNPAAVCPLDAWLDDATLQSIAAENNLSETAFIVASDAGYDLRWFTPAIEVDLCGHATLAAGYVVLNHLQPDLDAVAFETLSGRLIVSRDGDRLSMDFPARAPTPVAVSQALSEALGEAPSEVHASRDIVAVYDDEASVRRQSPDQARLLALDEGLGVIATAKGDAVDFVSRFSCPKPASPRTRLRGRRTARWCRSGRNGWASHGSLRTRCHRAAANCIASTGVIASS